VTKKPETGLVSLEMRSRKKVSRKKQTCVSIAQEKEKRGGSSLFRRATSVGSLELKGSEKAAAGGVRALESVG